MTSKHSEESKRKMSLQRLGENNPNWKGDDVGYGKLHKWVRNRLPKSNRCPNCNEVKPLDLANITGVYKRDPSNWKYLCRKCHMILDKVVDHSQNYCSVCGSNETYIRKNGKPHWLRSKITGGRSCKKCSWKEYERPRK